MALTALLALGSPAFAQSQKTDIRPHANRVIGEEITAHFSGVTHEGAYNFTDAGDPRRFYTETTGADGRANYKEETLQTVGEWFTKNDTLCFRYNREDMSGGCFRVYTVGNCFYYYSDSLFYRRNELDRDYWTARSVKAGEVANCEPGLS